ncbi:chemotaxis protein CheA [Leptospira ilyithenensis]|uniref:Chemotaxis protein CheA n=1 Tax=Leptospira ilyithenensis TaxID=2484901 RepID=A0A4V6QMS3_9LEPT|nr:chemotaxis protein CheA [Leptospira ilyithenensis]TGN08538.1 chemotaxis protein CheA [Leptospira ilyithenensis]
MDLSEVIDVYFNESNELLRDMESILLRMEKETPDPDSLNALFRAVHTIKGNSGMFGFEETVKFTHIIENLLDDLREFKIPFQKQLTEILLSAKDHLEYLIHAEPKSEITKERLESGKTILNSIYPYLKKRTSSEKHISEEKPETDKPEQPAPGNDTIPYFLISFRPNKNVFGHGLDPISFLAYLKKLGEIKFIKTITSELPTIENYNPEDSFLGFEISFQSDSSLEKIQKVFEFIESDSFLHILPPGATVEDLSYLAGQLPEEEIFLGNVWKEMGILNNKTLVSYLNRLIPPSNNESQPKMELETLISQKKIQTQGTVLKVDSQRVDLLINRVGELVVSAANLNQLVSNTDDSNLQESSFLVSRLLNEVREISLKLRMIQIGDIFQKYQRNVRDLGRELKKEINLHIIGKETELDRNIVDKLGDPLVHIIRNACDHGLETPEERIGQGKPIAGNIWLNAYHDTGSVVIEIKDDGKGIQSDIVWKKALEKKLVSGNKPENNEEIYKLLFLPGFSTASSITNVSGRGVGLDVVQKGIEALRGTIHVQSSPNKGSVFTIRLPLTLAIIEGFLVSVGTSLYIIPMEMVLECLDFTEENPDTKNNYFPLRGTLIPYIKMRDIFSQNTDYEKKKENIVIVRMGENKAGLVVEQLYGEFQTVIKPMGSVFHSVKGVSGSSILADGKVALILDLPSLFERTIHLEKIKTLNETRML